MSPRRLKLRDLRPQWLSSEATRTAVGGRYGLGFVFDCPICAALPHQLAVPFLRPFDGEPQLRFFENTPLYCYCAPVVFDFETASITPALRHEGSLVFIDKGEVWVVPEFDS